MVGEVGLRRGIDPVRVVAVIHLVHVLGEDSVFRPALAELDREAGLLDLPLEGPLLRDVEVAHELLGDGGAALNDVAGAQVAPGGTDDALVVDAAVLVEAVVLDRDRRPALPDADPVQADARPVLFRRDRAQKRAVRRIDERVLAVLDRLQLREVAARPELRHRADPAGDESEQEDEEADEEDPQPTLATVLAGASAPPRAAKHVLEIVVAAAPAARRRRRRRHANTPASRRRLCARRRSSLSRRSAAGSSSAQTLTISSALSPSAATKMSARSSSAASRSSPLTASRSESRGTWTVTCASFLRPRIEELRMVSEAIRSFGMTSRSLSSTRMKV